MLPIPFVAPESVSNFQYQVLPVYCSMSAAIVTGSSVFLLQLVFRSISFSDTTSGLNLTIHLTRRAGSHTPSVPTPPWWVFQCSTRSVVELEARGSRWRRRRSAVGHDQHRASRRRRDRSARRTPDTSPRSSCSRSINATRV